MSSPDSALEAYARLRSADRITVNLVRRGQPTTVDYSIR
jgi:general secretion pathway protein C